MAPLIWLVTGSTSGIGKAVIQEIVARGDKVIASGRRVEERLGDLKSDSLALLELDIGASQEVITAAIQKAWGLFGHIDVLLSNAGMSAMRSAEEADDAFLNTVYTVNLFGPIRVTQAILPLFRARGSGVLAYTSSSTAWNSLPFMTHYASSKAALSTYVEGLHLEVSSLNNNNNNNIRAVAFECGGCPTELGHPREPSSSSSQSTTTIPNTTAIPEYFPILTKLGGMFAGSPELYMPGDLKKVAKAIVDVTKREGAAEGKRWSPRVPLGSDGYEQVKAKVETVGEILAEYKDVSCGTDRDEHPGGTTGEMLDFLNIFERK